MSPQDTMETLESLPERCRFLEALLGQLEARGMDEIKLVPPDGKPLGDNLLGGSLRLSFTDGTAADHAIVAPTETAAMFVRWLFDLHDSIDLSEAGLLDAIGETLNQAVGRIKEMMLDDGEPEPLMGVPSLVRSHAATWTGARSGYFRSVITSTGWPGGVLIVATPREPLPLRILTECEAALDHLEGTQCFIRLQALLAELEEALIARPKALLSSLRACDELAVQVIQTGCDPEPIVTQVHSRLATIRPLVESTIEMATQGFELPADEEDAELLWEYLEDGNGQLRNARAAMDTEGEDPLPVVFRALHTLKGNAGFFGLHQIQALSHVTEDLVSQMQSGGLGHTDATLGLCRQSLDLIGHYHTLLEEVLESGGSIAHQDGMTRLSLHLRQIVRGERTPELLDDGEAANDAPPDEEWFKLRLGDLERLEALELDLAHVSESTAPDPAELTRIRDALVGVLTNVRRVSLDRLLSKVARLCRETADKLQKVVRVETHASGVTVPKHVFAAISGPLVHLARNAVDHGIEAFDEREAAGKPRMGTIVCEAVWERGWLTLEVRDDGRGLSAERIRDKAIRVGLIEPDTEMDDHRLLQLVTAPGFSTADKVSDISGRGVGLDVVQSEVSAVGGRLEIDSTPGEGTCFRLILPERPEMAHEADTSDEDDDFDVESGGELNFL